MAAILDQQGMHTGAQSFPVAQQRLNNRDNNGGNSSSGSNDRSNGSTEFPFEEGKSNGDNVIKHQMVVNVIVL